jgi:MerR family transcriptional regulator, copper efflux regulator
METVTSYSISEAAALLKLSAKTIRRYVKAGKLPSTKVSTKFGDEYRITEIPEELKKEALAQAEAEANVEIVSIDDQDDKLDTQQLYQENMRLAAQLGAATERIRQLEEQVKTQQNLLAPANDRVQQFEEKLKILESVEQQLKTLQNPVSPPPPPPPVSWWKRLFGRK